MPGGARPGAELGMIVDAHNHVWSIAPEKYPWQPIGGYLPSSEASVDGLMEVMDAVGVDRAVLVQPTPYGWSNEYLLDAVRSCPERFKAVCLVDPCSQESPAKLRQLVCEQGVKGVRFNWNLDISYAWSADALHAQIWSVAQELDIPVCLQLGWSQLSQAADMANRFPQVRIVVDHLGRPQPGSREDAPGFQQFLALAEHSNCYAKLSGLYYFSQQKAPFSDTWTLLRAAVRTFGAQRCLWGSDFPFVLEKWSYQDWLATLRGELEFSPAELDFILGQTSIGLWW
jgi:predicted TIM-barrel fold metal-dependent hydrolase